jgi:hypothetical protein
MNRIRFQIPNVKAQMSNQIQTSNAIRSDINRSKGHHSRESGNPEKHWIPPYQVRGRLSQARNDKLYKSYAVTYKNFDFEL